MNRLNWIAAAGALCAVFAQPVFAQTVKVTPLGGIDGEFCAQDRALVFEDPNGTRILYDPGRTVAGGERSAPGQDRRRSWSATCTATTSATRTSRPPNAGTLRASPTCRCRDCRSSNVVDIALAKKSKIVTGSEMPPFFAAQAQGQRRRPGQLDAGALRRQRDRGRREASRRSRRCTATASTRLFIGGDLGKAMKAAGIAGDVGPATGYVLRFSNGLVA